MTFPAYLIPGQPPTLPDRTPDYTQFRLVSVVGGTDDDRLRTLKLAAAKRVSDVMPLASMRVYSDREQLWRFSGFQDIRSQRSLIEDLGQLPPVVLVDSLDPSNHHRAESIEHVKASIRPQGLLMVSYTVDHPVVHNADLVWWLDSRNTAATG